MATQQPVQRGAAHRGLDEPADHDQQVIDAQEQRTAQLDDDLLQLRRKRRMELVRPVRRVLDGLPVPPLVDRVDVHPVAGGQRLRGHRGGCLPDGGTRLRRGGRVLVESHVHGTFPAAAACGASPRGRPTREVSLSVSQASADKIRPRRGSP